MNKLFKLHFYKLDIDDSLFSKEPDKIKALRKLLNKAKKPIDVHEINGYKAFVRAVDKNVYCFEKHRITDLPAVGSVNNNTERNLELKKDETLIEKNYFLIDKSLGYIIFQEKNEGFRASSLSLYFHKLLKEETSKIYINQILKTSAYERLSKYGYLKSMEIGLASPSDVMLKDFGISLNERIGYRKNSGMRVSVKISLDRKESLVDGFINDIKSKFDKYNDNITKLELKGSQTAVGSLDCINLAKDVLGHEVNVGITDNHIDEDDIVQQLTITKDMYKAEIGSILKK